MIDEIQRLFREAWAAFRTEALRSEPEDRVAALLSAMRREMVAARTALPLYEEALRRAEAELAREQTDLADCVRRRALAEKVGDAETVRVAAEFTARHQAAIGVHEAKVNAARAEWELRRREADEMMRRYKDADANRFALLAEMRARAAHATLDSLLDADDPDTGGPFERQTHRVEDASAYADAMAELNEDAPDPASPDPAEVDRRLAELKRRMGRR